MSRGSRKAPSCTAKDTLLEGGRLIYGQRVFHSPPNQSPVDEDQSLRQPWAYNVFAFLSFGISDGSWPVCHCLHSDSASPKPGKRRRATLIIFVMAQCR